MKVCSILKREDVRYKAGGGVRLEVPDQLHRSPIDLRVRNSSRAGLRVGTSRWMSFSFTTCAVVGVVRQVGR